MSEPTSTSKGDSRSTPRAVRWPPPSPTAALLCLALGCARVSNGGGGTAGTDGSAADVPAAPEVADIGVDVGGTGPDVTTAKGPCVNLQCQQVSCPAGTTTTVSGTTYAPNGKLPLYNVMVYVPNAPLTAFTEGVSCDRCGGGAPTRAVASAISDEHGQFRITNVPAGKDIPMVFQVGKWRRKVTLGNVVACQDNPITDANLSRLPRNRQEGDMPRIAVTTGDCDFLGCLLPQVGVDMTELGIAGQNRAVTYFKGDVDATRGYDQPPTGATDATTLWRSEAELSKYDMALLSCECREVTSNKGPLAYAAMNNYLAKGGRIFGTDFMYIWYRGLTDPKLTGAISLRPPPGDNDDRDGGKPMLVDTTFPKGKALADWMKFVDPTATYGQINANQVFDNVVSVTAPPIQVWATAMPATASTAGPRVFSVNTPVGVPAAQQCGRAVHMDAHIAPTQPVGLPAGFKIDFDLLCGGGLTQGEQVLAFLFFDLAACIQDDSRPVVPPLIIP
ncbi:MAG: hypothetical protein QOI66_4428 [Myxococcales bacterium]|nr:hypothetical protein [Myxococcales bacterium]